MYDTNTRCSNTDTLRAWGMYGAWGSVLSAQFLCKIKTAQKIKSVDFFFNGFLTFSMLNFIMISCSKKLDSNSAIYIYINSMYNA